MTGTDSGHPLDQLAGLHLPEPVSAFPWAPGWWALLAAGVLLATAAVLALLRRHRRRRYRRQALAELQAIAERYRATEDDARMLQQLNQLLRRVAMVSYPQREVSGLTGEQWREFLCSCPGAETCLAPGEARLLAVEAYRPDARIEAAGALFEHCAQWLRRHRNRSSVRV